MRIMGLPARSLRFLTTTVCGETCRSNPINKPSETEKKKGAALCGALLCCLYVGYANGIGRPNVGGEAIEPVWVFLGSLSVFQVVPGKAVNECPADVGVFGPAVPAEVELFIPLVDVIGRDAGGLGKAAHPLACLEHIAAHGHAVGC